MYRATTSGTEGRANGVNPPFLSPDLVRSRWLTSRRLRLILIAGFLTTIALNSFWMSGGRAKADEVLFTQPARRSSFSWRAFNAGIEALRQQQIHPSRQTLKKG